MARPRTPASEKRRNGNPGRRPIQTPPRGLKDRPRKPRGLSKNAARLWDDLMDDLSELGLLSRSDRKLYEAYVREAATLDECYAMQATHGSFVVEKDSRGEEKHKRAPWMVQMRDSVATIRRLADQLGLSPTSRSKLDVDPPDEDDGLMEFLRGPFHQND